MDNFYKNIFVNNKNLSPAEFVKSTDLKNRFLYPYLPTIVIDNFYDEPELWRTYALDQEYFKGDRGNWPGLRTELLHTLNKDLFDVTLKKLLFVLKDYGITSVNELQTGFQLIDESYGKGWVHDDDPAFQVAGVIYLNKNAPLGSGTTIYNDMSFDNHEKFTKVFEEDVNLSESEKQDLHIQVRDEQRSLFTANTVVENVFNRLVMFDSRSWHSADNFFGSTKEDSRLTQVFFIKLA